MNKTEIAALLNRLQTAQSAQSAAQGQVETAAHALKMAQIELERVRAEQTAVINALSAAWSAAS